MPPWWSLLRLLYRHPIIISFESIHCSSYEDQWPVSFIKWHPIFEWLAAVINSLFPKRYYGDRKCVILQHITMVDIFSIYIEITLRWIPHDFTDDRSTLVKVILGITMEWMPENLIDGKPTQATSHLLNQCWTRSLMLLSITRPRFVKPAAYLTYLNEITIRI